jgi:hypothetical protein
MTKQDLYEESLAELLLLREEFRAQQISAWNNGAPRDFLSRDIEAIDGMIIELNRQHERRH